MKSKGENSTRSLIIAACVVLAGALVFAPSASLQQGGNFTIKPSVVPGGGGSSTSGPTNVAGTIGQAVLGFSSGGQFSLNAGFWQGGAAPCSVPTIASHHPARPPVKALRSLSQSRRTTAELPINGSRTD